VAKPSVPQEVRKETRLNGGERSANEEKGGGIKAKKVGVSRPGKEPKKNMKISISNTTRGGKKIGRTTREREDSANLTTEHKKPPTREEKAKRRTSKVLKSRRRRTAMKATRKKKRGTDG